MDKVTRALVVGGTNGIGYAMASRIASESRAATVIISGRTKPDNLPHSNMEFRKLDASSMRAIKQYTDQYKASQEGKLDLLIMSQGILTMAGRTETSEGIDRKMALHYYGKQLLIRELLPALAEDAKVIIVLDGLSGAPNKLIWEDLDLKTNFSLKKAAEHCLSMTDAMIQEHAAQQKAEGNKRHFVHAFPGFVKTGIMGNLPWYLRPAVHGIFLFATSPETCAENLLRGTAETAKAGEKEGRFWANLNSKGELAPNKAIWSEEQRKQVADHTWKLVDGVLNASS